MLSKEPTEDELLAEIDRVCLPDPIPMPGELDMAGCAEGEEGQIVAFLDKRPWKDVTLDSLKEKYSGDPAVLPSRINGYGYSYYVGAFLSVLVKDGRREDCGLVSFGIIWSLLRNSDTLAMIKAKVARDVLRYHKKELDPDTCYDGDIIDAALNAFEKRIQLREDESAPNYRIFS